MGLNKNIWGPSLWLFLHTISINYPPQPSADLKKQYLLFFKSLEFILPCKSCRIHYSNFLIKHPIDDSLENQQQLFDWVLKLHNEVNRHNKKRPWTRIQCSKLYTSLYANSSKWFSYPVYFSRSFVYVMIVLIVLLISLNIKFIFFK